MTLSALQSNRLASSTSPYLLQHADNPVNWQTWSSETLAAAQQVKKPILLSIGYAACHWCHVMAHESFEDPETAELMNELFVNIKVDREERPDLDQTYMTALHAIGEQGGWPLTMFLMPDGKPFFGGTYYPPTPMHGRPAFRDLLLAVSKAFHNESESIEKNASALMNHLSSLSKPPDTIIEPSEETLHKFSERTLKIYDPINGGVRGVPKFPNAPILEHWGRMANGNPDSPAGNAFVHTLTQISLGGIYDHLGGGISRYTVDDIWLVPHFEKMLYDNAHFVRHLVYAWQLTGATLFRRRIEETINWMKTDLYLEGKAFASSLDADSEGEEGKFYVWTRQEVRDVLKDDDTFKLFCETYDITSAGNWEGKNILNLTRIGEPDTALHAQLNQPKSELLNHRNKRIHPGLDDKILVDWNGFAVRALVEAAAALERPDWFQLAEDVFGFVAESISDGNLLSHSWKDGRSVRPAMSSDYATMMNAAISLYEYSGNSKYLSMVESWLEILNSDYSDEMGGYFLTSCKSDDLATRPRCDTDDANPSAASQILEAKIRYANLVGDISILEEAEKTAGNLAAISENSAYGMTGYMNALHSYFNHRHISVTGSDRGEREHLRKAAWQIPDFAKTIHEERGKSPKAHFGIEMTNKSNFAEALVCSNQTCSLPVKDPAKLPGIYWSKTNT